MPWYSGLIFIVLFVGCSMQQPTIGKKSFENEDSLIVKALLQKDNNISKSINIFHSLYQKSKKYVYLKEIIKLYFDKKQYLKTINLVEQFIKKYPTKQYEILNYKIYSYIELKQFNKALMVAKEILNKKRDLETYNLIAYIYVEIKNYKEAIKYLKTAYAISHSAKVLAQMGDLFFKELKSPNEAISYYQTHIRLYGCDEIICNRLAQIYKFLIDYDNLIYIYKRLYDDSRDIMYADKIVYLYVENEKYKEALQFIEKNRLGDRFLYIVYKARLQKENSYQDAYKLYKLTGELKYFFFYSVDKFEKSSKSLIDLKNVIANLEILIKKDRKGVYLNYLGYILIDYDIDPKRGIKLVQEALEYNPTSIEFLDSLAWGFYKVKQCKKAYQIISKINIDDKEINKHKKKIRRCYDFRKNNK
jgi:tetratricopeptide (TPR) repeat protein